MLALQKIQRRFVHEPLIKDKIFSYMTDKLELPKLQYGHKDLEPVISEEIMRVHHLKHHQTYINKYIDVMKFYEAEHSIHAFDVLLRKANFNGGGHINHCLFWKSLVTPSNQHEPVKEFADNIIRDFGSFEKLCRNMKIIAADVQGSGWLWLGYDMSTNGLCLATTQNQDILRMTTGLIPLLGIDLWEHAYHMQYKNDRAAYVENIIKILNWDYAAQLMADKSKIASEIKNEGY